MKSATHPESKSIVNRRLSHDFFIEKRFEAGIALCGTEVKSLRCGNGVMVESFIRLDRFGRPVWVNAHIGDYKFGNVNNHASTRSRLLLLHKREINELRGALERKGEAVLPVKLYFKSGLAKLEIAICKPKKLFDKRRDLKEKAEQREAARVFSRKHL